MVRATGDKRTGMRRVAALALGLALATPALAQPAPDPAVAAPSNASVAGGEDTILWYPAPSRCTFFKREDQARFRPDDPQTWRFRFLVMAEPKAGESAVRAERGYVMANGLVRELEKVRSGPDADGASVTVWRSAGEPRLNITTTLRPDAENESRQPGRTRLVGTLATIRGDGRDIVDIVGSCDE